MQLPLRHILETVHSSTSFRKREKAFIMCKTRDHKNILKYAIRQQLLHLN